MLGCTTIKIIDSEILYGCDYENDLIGIQIKPISYKNMNSPYQMKAKENHKAQADAYRDKYKVPHIVIYYDGDNFYDKDYVFNQINTMLALKINVIF